MRAQTAPAPSAPRGMGLIRERRRAPPRDTCLMSHVRLPNLFTTCCVTLTITKFVQLLKRHIAERNDDEETLKELPESAPVVRAQKSWYSAGDLLRANCSAPPADPPANLTWLLNGHQVQGLDIPPQHVPQLTKKQPLVTDASLEDANRIIFSPWEPIGGYEDPVTDNVIDIPGNIDAVRYQDFGSSREETSTRRSLYETTSGPVAEERSNRTTANSQLVMRVQAGHFHKGRLNVTCVARVLTAYAASAELLLDEERPQLALVMGSRDSNAGFQHSGPRAGAFAVLSCLFWLWSVR